MNQLLNSRGHMKSLTVYFLSVSRSIRLTLLSHQNVSEHELTWLAFKNITRGPTLSEKDRHLCMRDERIRRDTCQSFLPKAPNSVTSEQCRVLVPSFRGLRMERHGPWPPFWRGNRLHFMTRALRIRGPSKKQKREKMIIRWLTS